MPHFHCVLLHRSMLSFSADESAMSPVTAGHYFLVDDVDSFPSSSRSSSSRSEVEPMAPPPCRPRLAAFFSCAQLPFEWFTPTCNWPSMNPVIRSLFYWCQVFPTLTMDALLLFFNITIWTLTFMWAHKLFDRYTSDERHTHHGFSQACMSSRIQHDISLSHLTITSRVHLNLCDRYRMTSSPPQHQQQQQPFLLVFVSRVLIPLLLTWVCVHSLPPYRRSPLASFTTGSPFVFTGVTGPQRPVFIPASDKPPVQTLFPPATVFCSFLKSSANSLPSADKNDSHFYPLHPVAVYSVLFFGTSQKCFSSRPLVWLPFTSNNDCWSNCDQIG